MSGLTRSFDRINIPAPCDADWDSMIGNDQVRFCEHCALHVTDLSALPRRDAMRLVERSQGRLCVRFVTLADGSLLTRGTVGKLHQISRRASQIAAGAFTAALSFSSAAAQVRPDTGLDSQRPPIAASSIVTSFAYEAALKGNVTDPHGAVVMGATVILTRKGTGAAFVYVTGADGSYNFELLEAGYYTLSAEAPSFAESERLELKLAPQSLVNADVTLKLPELSEEIEVVLEQKEVHVIMGAVAVREPEDPLIKAVFNNDLMALVQQLPNTADINASDKATNGSAMAYAVGNNNLEMVNVLISAGASLNGANKNGETPLMYLSDDATAEFVRELVRLGARVDARDGEGRSVLMNTVRFGSLVVVKELIAAGAKVDEKDNEGNTVLMDAARNPDADILRHLIKAGAPLNRKNDAGESAVSIAVHAESAENLKVLIDAGATVNLAQRDLDDALLSAARSGSLSTVKLLLKLGARATAKDDDTTVLMLAAESGTPEMIKLLIDEGADLDAVNNAGWTAMMHANAVENVRVLLNAGANMAIRNKNGESALAMAIKYEQPEIAQLLKSRGAPE
jgi:ankyrin repeat protein